VSTLSGEFVLACEVNGRILWAVRSIGQGVLTILRTDSTGTSGHGGVIVKVIATNCISDGMCFAQSSDRVVED
jgi:hypothetical protein